MPIPSCIPYIPGEAPGTMTLWTRQAIPVALQLEQTGS